MVLIGEGDREVDEEKPGSVLAAASRTVLWVGGESREGLWWREE